MSTVVLYHNDADGFGAAFACWHEFNDHATYIPVQYKQPVPELPEGTTRLLIVDFSYDRATCEELASKYDLTIIDHHKTAKEALEGLDYAIFDMEKSGAVLTWEYFHPARPVPAILQYVQDYDLWKFELAYSEEVNAYIAMLPNDFEVWSQVTMAEAQAGGELLIRNENRQIERALKNVRVVNFLGYEVPVMNLTENISKVGNRMCLEYPEAKFSVSYCDRADGQRSYSLRSVGDFDVSRIAKHMGGGGHPRAAGFALPAPPTKTVPDLVECS